MAAKLLITCLIMITFSVSALAQGYVDLLPEEVSAPFQTEWKQINGEIRSSTKPDWTGTYYRDIGGTWSEVLLIGSNDRFAAYRDTCSNGPRAWVNQGRASFNDGLITLSAERFKTQEFTLEIADEPNRLISWGQERWIVPQSQIPLFVYSINSRSGEENERFYFKSDIPEEKRRGKPNVPIEFLSLLGRPPIKTEIVEIIPGDKKDSIWDRQVLVGAGKKQGVIAEMSFWVKGIKDFDMKLRVLNVGENSSQARIVSIGHRGDFSGPNEPRKHWKLSSRCC